MNRSISISCCWLLKKILDTTPKLDATPKLTNPESAYGPFLNFDFLQLWL